VKPFNLEAAKAGQPIVCRDGTPARFLAHVPEADEGYRVIVYIAGSSAVTDLDETGRIDDSHDYPSDLFMAEEPMKVAA
jgi:hypothetical protein